MFPREPFKGERVVPYYKRMVGECHTTDNIQVSEWLSRKYFHGIITFHGFQYDTRDLNKQEAWRHQNKIDDPDMLMVGGRLVVFTHLRDAVLFKLTHDQVTV